MSSISRPCIDGGQHRWLARIFGEWNTDRCTRCGGTRQGERVSCFYASSGWCIGAMSRAAVGVAVENGRWPRRRAGCEWCEVRALRLVAEVEQQTVKERLRADEEEVVSLYPVLQHRSQVHDIGTPQWWKERYPAWQAARLAQQETRRQRARLREGHRTLTAIRRHLQGREPLPLPESRPAKTSPTS